MVLEARARLSLKLSVIMIFVAVNPAFAMAGPR
jgi:hypothetical protein